jgi:hypothetical protein
MSKWSYDEISCNVMNDLENTCHEKQNAKRGTHFGALDQKLWPFEVPCTLGNDLIISPQPFIRCS